MEFSPGNREKAATHNEKRLSGQKLSPQVMRGFCRFGKSWAELPTAGDAILPELAVKRGFSDSKETRGGDLVSI